MITFNQTFPLMLLFSLAFCGVFKTQASENIPSPINIHVGIGARPPFLNADERTGLGPDMVAVMNLIQPTYKFSLKTMPTKRRLQALQEGWVDIQMWDNPNWGWQGVELSLSQPIVASRDVFIARRKVGRDQQYFDDFSKKKFAMVVGYHYKFADFETDIDKLAKRFDVKMVRTEEASIKMVLANRVDIAVVSETALRWFFKRFPGQESKLLISKKADTVYQRFFLVPANAPITAEELKQFLLLADEKGLLAPLYEKYGLTKPDFTLVE